MRPPIVARIALLTAIARALRADPQRYAALIPEHVGKPIVETEAQVEKRALTCAWPHRR